MSDLINREDVIKCLQENGWLDDTNIDELIETIPTAYSVDKAVEELEERTDFLKDCTKYGNKNAKQQAKSYSTMMMYEVADLVDDLLEIVKQGGVSDDVCEWKKSKDYPFDWLVGCDGCEVNHRQGDYCPRCGKKIKIVGD